VLFGLAISSIGIAITFAVSLGASAAAGALIPLITKYPERILSTQGMLVLLGITIILLGVGLCGLAGSRRDSSPDQANASSAPSFLRGFLYALGSGVLGSMLNLGLAFGGAIQERAREQGASIAMMSNAVWLPCLYAGFIPGVLYCLSIMKRNSNLEDLGSKARWFYWLMAACMGVLWFGSIICYSLSTVKLGDLGAVIGWPLFLSAVVIGSTITGLLAGEWTRARKGALPIMGAGVACLVVAMIVLARASG
jgi:L-rhamnose-H+ transport protein